PWSLFSARETEVVNLLLKGMSNKEIAQALGIEEITAKMHLNKIYRKLNVSSRIQAVTKILKKQ
ncbi:MAG: LuxR C-terminal-related transcriptional regulator, partial [Rhodospirillales bacterium]|nr:LuxR C-terminal-related transcriptional regulator [Rhodospirillales bacterium]